MKISILIVTYNRLDLLKKCLANIFEFRNQVNHILVVDNCSTDGTQSYLKKLGNMISYIQLPENIGGAGGFNRGIKYFYNKTNDDAVWILDDDTMLNSTALMALQRAATSVHKFGFLCSNVRWKDGSPAMMNVPQVDSTYWTECAEYPRVVRATFVAILVPRQVIKQVGYPIKEFFIWGDDTEYTQRISKQFPCYFVSDSRVIHETEANHGADLLTDNTDRLSRYVYAYRNRLYNARQAGGKTYIKYILRVILEFFKLLLHGPSHRFKRISVLFKGTIKGFFFNPKIQTIEDSE